MQIRQRATLPGPGWVQVPSLLVSLTSVFEMGTGVTSLLGPPVSFFEDIEKQNRWLKIYRIQLLYVQGIACNANFLFLHYAM